MLGAVSTTSMQFLSYAHTVSHDAHAKLQTGNEGLTNDVNEIDCVDGVGFAGIALAEFHDGTELLFVGGCSQVAMYDIATGQLVESVPNATWVGIDGSMYGQAFTQFQLSPDGDTLWALPQKKSTAHFYLARGGEDDMRQTYNRYMMLPIDLSQGDAPTADADFAVENIDDWEGETGIGDEVTPAIDPGVDVNYVHYTRYLIEWAPGLAGSDFGSASIPTGPAIAVTNNAIWMRGSGSVGVSGLGKGGNLAVYSLADRQAVLWPRGDDDFYRFWQGGSGGEPQFGFDLTPDADEAVSVVGILYVP